MKNKGARGGIHVTHKKMWRTILLNICIDVLYVSTGLAIITYIKPERYERCPEWPLMPYNRMPCEFKIPLTSDETVQEHALYMHTINHTIAWSLVFALFAKLVVYFENEKETKKKGLLEPLLLKHEEC